MQRSAVTKDASTSVAEEGEQSEDKNFRITYDNETWYLATVIRVTGEFITYRLEERAVRFIEGRKKILSWLFKPEVTYYEAGHQGRIHRSKTSLASIAA